MEDRTKQEIDDYCEKVLNLHLSSHPEGKLLFEGVQIVRQLQAEKARLAEIVALLLPAYKRHCDFTKACEIENELKGKDRRGND